MNKIVFVENKQVVTDSLTVAEVFGKRHADVLRSIDNLECSDDFNERNFASVDYVDAKGQTRRKVIMSQDGFSFLVMGYTGKEAARFKEMYISEFNRMRDQLNNTPVLSERQALIQSLKLTAELAEEMDAIKGTTEAHGTKLVELEHKVETQITLNSGEQRRIQKAISSKVYEIESDPEARSELFRQLHREIKDRWQVPSYKDIRRQDLLSVINYINAWVPIRRAG